MNHYDDARRVRCPYLAEGGQECLMTNGGLYIPMPEHVNTLCITARFGRCHQYIYGCSSVSNLAGQLDFTHNTSRRRYRRVPERIPLQLADHDHEGSCSEILDNTGFTLDLSLGGIRIESQVELPVRKKIAFLLGQNGTAPYWGGQGEVRWSEKQKSGTFHSGLIVTDKKTFQSLGQHLSLSGLSSL